MDSNENPKKLKLRHVIIKLSKLKDKGNFESSKRKATPHNKGTTIRLSVYFSAETLQARREWDNTFKILKEKKCQPRTLYPRKLFFKNEGEIDIPR